MCVFWFVVRMRISNYLGFLQDILLLSAQLTRSAKVSKSNAYFSIPKLTYTAAFSKRSIFKVRIATLAIQINPVLQRAWNSRIYLHYISNKNQADNSNPPPKKGSYLTLCHSLFIFIQITIVLIQFSVKLIVQFKMILFSSQKEGYISIMTVELLPRKRLIFLKFSWLKANKLKNIFYKVYVMYSVYANKSGLHIC